MNHPIDGNDINDNIINFIVEKSVVHQLKHLLTKSFENVINFMIWNISKNIFTVKQSWEEIELLSISLKVLDKFKVFRLDSSFENLY